GGGLIPYWRFGRGSGGGWLRVLGGGRGGRSGPWPAASSASSGTVSPPSECTVWVCRSPASQRQPGRAGRSRGGGRSPAASGGGAAARGDGASRPGLVLGSAGTP